MNGSYREDRENRLTLKYRTGKRRKKLGVDGTLRVEIIDQLKLGIGPDVIACRRKLDKQAVNISTERIYQFIYTSSTTKEEKLYLYLAIRRRSRLHHGTCIKQKRVV